MRRRGAYCLGHLGFPIHDVFFVFQPICTQMRRSWVICNVYVWCGWATCVHVVMLVVVCMYVVGEGWGGEFLLMQNLRSMSS